MLAMVIQGVHCGCGLVKKTQRQPWSALSVEVMAVHVKICLGYTQELKNFCLGFKSIHKVEIAEGENFMIHFLNKNIN